LHGANPDEIVKRPQESQRDFAPGSVATHGRVDHYYGVHQILESFPNARAISNRESAARAREDSSPQRLQSQWNVMRLEL